MSMTWLPLLFFLQIDFSLAVFFVVYFFIRFLAADDKLMFLVTVETLVDFFTVPSVFLSGNFDMIVRRNFFKKNLEIWCYITRLQQLQTLNRHQLAYNSDFDSTRLTFHFSYVLIAIRLVLLFGCTLNILVMPN